jgi:endoglucanase Acf2
METRVDWGYTPENALVTTRYTITTKPMEGTETKTLFALYPHQWRHTETPLSGLTYVCLRGPLKLAAGNGFVTQMKFPGILPVLPNANPGDTAAIRSLLDEAAAQKSQFAPDTYWDGKNLGRLATLMQIGQQTGPDAAAGEFRQRLRNRLETWLRATDANGQPKTQQLFYYDANWGALIGCPASYGSDVELNDHAFHYGYFVHAAAALAFHDPEWARAWGPLIELLARDMACGDRGDSRFPFLRVFDPYAGHSWASGAGKFADGNNQESSSEAMNAWAGLMLWGEATGNTTLRDLGAWLFTTELAAVEDYWFDVTGELRPKEYTPSVVTMVWGGKSVNETWFSPKPEDIHMINWLPFTGPSMYLGRYPAYVRRNYEALRREVGSEEWRRAADLILMYRALDDPDDALRQYQARATTLTTDSGNSKANVLYWIGNLKVLGQVDRSITGNQPMVAVFLREGNRTYVAYNAQPQPKTVRFSDGMTLDCPSRSMVMRTRKTGNQP